MSSSRSASGAPISNRFTRAYGVRHPFACAGMGFVGMTPPLTVAVCQAGGVGAVGVGKMSMATLRQTILDVRKQTGGIFHVNVITLFADDYHVDLCIEEDIEIASFHWGHPPRAWIDRLRESGVRVWEQVGSPDAAKRAVDDGVDLVIAQGSEAGGHNYGALPTFVLVPQVVDAVGPALVLAAGGIVDGRGVAAALALGADGVCVGTRMVATDEANAADGYKQCLIDGDETVLTSMFGKGLPAFNPMRVLENPIVRDWNQRFDEVPEDLSKEPVVGQMHVEGVSLPLQRFASIIAVAGATGDMDQLPLPAGQGVGLIREIEPAGVVIARMMDDAARILASANAASATDD